MIIEVPFIDDWIVPFCCDEFSSGVTAEFDPNVSAYWLTTFPGVYQVITTLNFTRDFPATETVELTARIWAEDNALGIRQVASQSVNVASSYVSPEGMFASIEVSGLVSFAEDGRLWVTVSNSSTAFDNPIWMHSESQFQVTWEHEALPVAVCGNWPEPPTTSFAVVPSGDGGDIIGGTTVYTSTYTVDVESRMSQFQLISADTSAGFPVFDLMLNGAVVDSIDTAVVGALPYTSDPLTDLVPGDEVGFSCSGMGTGYGRVYLTGDGADSFVTWL